MSQIKSNKVYDLYFYCPACPVKKQKSPQYWQHTICKTRWKIDLNGIVGCSGYTKSCVKKKFVNWNFTCNNHSNESRKVNSYYFTAAAIKASSSISKVKSAYPHGILDEIIGAVYEQCMYLYIYIYVYI